LDEKVLKVNSLILAIASGDKSALDTLFLEFGGLLLAMAKKYVVDNAKAEDVVSEVLLRLVKNAKSFKKDFNGLNWLFKSIKHEALNQNKKDNRRDSINIDDCFDLKDVLDLEKQSIEKITLAIALDKLGVVEKKALYYKFWEGLTVREIAKKLKIAKSSCQDIITAALNKLEIYLK